MICKLLLNKAVKILLCWKEKHWGIDVWLRSHCRRPAQPSDDSSPAAKTANTWTVSRTEPISCFKPLTLRQFVKQQWISKQGILGSNVCLSAWYKILSVSTPSVVSHLTASLTTQHFSLYLIFLIFLSFLSALTATSSL